MQGSGCLFGEPAAELNRGLGVRPLTLEVRRSLRGIGSVAVAAALGALAVPGCTSSEKIKLAANGAPEYHSLQISYDLASTPELRRLDEPSPVEQTAHVDPVSNSVPAKTTRPWTARRVHLELQYPYPGVHPAFVRATLRVVADATSKPAEKPSAWSLTFASNPAPKPQASEPAALPAEDLEDSHATDEVLYIDIPKTEVDAVLGELAKADFFSVPSNPDGASHVVVVFNKGRCEKGWSRDERLDRLIDLLRQHGAPLPAPAPKKT
jgi:hypothetical protein